jgi:hypothetical protein
MLTELSTQSNLTLLLPTEAAMNQLPSDFTTELLNNKVPSDFTTGYSVTRYTQTTDFTTALRYTKQGTLRLYQ